MVRGSTCTGGTESECIPLRTTLLELVTAVSKIAESEDETVATVLALLVSGEVQLIGSFNGCRSEFLPDSLTLTR